MTEQQKSRWGGRRNRPHGNKSHGASDASQPPSEHGHHPTYKKHAPKPKPEAKLGQHESVPHANHGDKKGFFGMGGNKKMRIIPLGGLEEVGKNIMAVEHGNDIIVIDCGMSFAGPEMLGVDYIVPDISYLEERKRNVRAIIFTHGHLDHIGAVQYALPKLGNPPIYASRLTAGLLKNRLREFGLDKSAKVHEFNETSHVKLGSFEVEFFRVNHSIPDGMGVFVKTPAGSMVHTGDFKFDYSPAIDKPVDFQRIAEIGRKGVDVLMADSTNASKPGFCRSEQEIANTLEDLISKTKGRLIITSFSSLIGRINQVCNFAHKYNRKVFLAGRSMVENMKLAEQLNYTTYPKGTVRKMDPQVNSLPPHQTVILTTGAQGEAMSALSRMALGEHAQVKIKEGDTVVISASPIPGNELAIVNVINNLCAQGAKVITNVDMDVHTSGHAHQEELKLMYSLIKPKCYVPIHGELFMRINHIEMIKKIADPKMHTAIMENNGDVLEVGKDGIRKSKQKISANDILVDGLGFGEIGSKVIAERKAMSTDGILIVLFRAYQETKNLIGEPDIISRGFVYVKESEEVANETKKVAQKAFETVAQHNRNIPLKELKGEVEMRVSRFIRKRIGREPMVIPIIMYI